MLKWNQDVWMPERYCRPWKIPSDFRVDFVLHHSVLPLTLFLHIGDLHLSTFAVGRTGQSFLFIYLCGWKIFWKSYFGKIIVISVQLNLSTYRKVSIVSKLIYFKLNWANNLTIHVDRLSNKCKLRKVVTMEARITFVLKGAIYKQKEHFKTN